MSFIVDTGVQVPVRDGSLLATTVWRPASGAPAPTLLMRHPYGTDITSGYGGTQSPDILALMAAGYAVAVQDCRGAFHSEGVFTPHVDDRNDGVDTVAWLVEQEWCDGRVGTYGASYGGFVQWLTASTGVEALKAMVPTVTSDDFYLSPWYSPGGALSLETVFSWTTMVALMRAQFEVSGGGGDPKELMALAEVMADPRGAMSVAPTSSQELLERHLPWLGDVLRHPSRDEYWQRLGPVRDVSSITVPALNIGGWYDLFVTQTVRSYTTMREGGGSVEAREGQRLVIGPWAHTPGGDTGIYPDRHFGMAGSVVGSQLTDIQLRFLDRWLRGNEDALEGTAPVRIFVMGLDQWRDEQEWPLPDTQYTDYFLSASGPANTAEGAGLLSSAEPESEKQDTYLYDPRRPVPTLGGNIVALAPQDLAGPVDQRPVEARDDVLCFTTPVLENPVEVTGPVSLTVFVSSSAADTDFTGKLVDVFPDGRAIILCEGIQRGRYRNSLADPELMQPGEIYDITLNMSVTSNVFLPGHRIRLEVSSSNFPRYDRNGNTGGVIAEETEADMVIAVNHLHHGPAHPSRLTLPIIDR
ncbi:CocE/NonD family hydrolase [Streptomyces sp. NBC_00075]|uniref:CocE/NonD family hydrolase n=1 Tax=Streptomyces sp. NBC_00075 TaxID=2975641 RepID=UPI003246F263